MLSDAAVWLMVYVCATEEVVVFTMAATAWFIFATDVGIAAQIVRWIVFSFHLFFGHDDLMSIVTIQVVKYVFNGDNLFGVLIQPCGELIAVDHTRDFIIIGLNNKM